MKLILTSVEDINEDGRDQRATVEIDGVATVEDLLHAFSQFAAVSGFRFIDKVGCVSSSGKEFWSQ